MPTYFTFTKDSAKKIVEDHREQLDAVKSQLIQNTRWMNRQAVRNDVVVGVVTTEISARTNNVSASKDDSDPDGTTLRHKAGSGKVELYKVDSEDLLIPTGQTIDVLNLCTSSVAADKLVTCKREPMSHRWFVDLECCD